MNLGTVRTEFRYIEKTAGTEFHLNENSFSPSLYTISPCLFACHGERNSHINGILTKFHAH